MNVSRALEAAQLLFQNGEQKDCMAILKKLWEEVELKPLEEFKVFCALIEVWSIQKASEVTDFLEAVISGEGAYHSFWLRRTAAEQSVLLDWHGQICLAAGDRSRAFDSFGRAASLGRDTHALWKNLGNLYIEAGDLELGLRYVRRSLQLFRQMDLDLLSGKEEVLGSFTGRSLTKSQGALEDYLEILLKATKLAKGQKNLKGVRELVLEMIHQFPQENRLPKIRILIERAIVESSLQYGQVVPQQRPQPQLSASPTRAPLSSPSL